MEKKLHDAFDSLYMSDDCAQRIEEKLCKPKDHKLYSAVPVPPTRRGWLKGAALAAMLAVVLGCILIPAGLRQVREATTQERLALCQAALEELQSRDTVHITASATVEGVDGEEATDNEYLQHGDLWLRVGEMYFTDRTRNYTVGNLSVNGTQYRFGHAGNHNWDASFNWSVATQAQLWEKFWLMEFDLTDATIASVDGEGNTITIVFDGNPRPDSDTVYETCTQTWYLDGNGRLTALTEEVTYLQGEATVHSVTEITVPDSDEEFVAYVINKNLSDMRITVEDAMENKDLEGVKLEEAYLKAQLDIMDGLRYTEGNITYSYVGWGNDLNSGTFYDTNLHTPWTEMVDGRVIFTCDRQTIDITNQFSEEEPFTYIYTDSHYITHYIAIGGTAENPGFIEMRKVCWTTKMIEGNLGGISINTWNNAAESRYGWEQRAKEIFEPYGVYWVS